MKRLIVAVDGPSGAGKSTVSKMLASKLGLTYIDTGAMYRAVALKSKREGVDPDDREGLAAIATSCRISFEKKGDRNITCLDGEDVSEDIRDEEISLLTSRVSSVPDVRNAMVKLQREMGIEGRVIMDGRDVGTVIFPDADFKFYLDASLETRGNRRHLELQEKAGRDIEVNETIRDMAARDQADSTREESPLKIADDAVYIDTTGLSVAEVVRKMEDIISSGRG